MGDVLPAASTALTVNRRTSPAANGKGMCVPEYVAVDPDVRSQFFGAVHVIRPPTTTRFDTVIVVVAGSVVDHFNAMLTWPL